MSLCVYMWCPHHTSIIQYRLDQRLMTVSLILGDCRGFVGESLYLCRGCARLVLTKIKQSKSIQLSRPTKRHNQNLSTSHSPTQLHLPITSTWPVNEVLAADYQNWLCVYLFCVNLVITINS